MLYKKLIKKYNLTFSIELNKIDNVLKDLKSIYKLSSIDEAFFYFVKNELGSELCKFGEEYEDALSWLLIDKKPNSNWFLFHFEESDDYMEYKLLRNDIHYKIKNKRLLNWFELNCVEFLTDSNKINSTNMKYYYLAKLEYINIYFVTNGLNIKVLDLKYIDLETLSFTDLYNQLFADGYNIEYLGESINK